MKRLALDDPHLIRGQLLDLAEKVPGAWVGMKIAALLLVLEGERMEMDNSYYFLLCPF